MFCFSKLILVVLFLIVDLEGFLSFIYIDKIGYFMIGYGYNLSVYFYEGKCIIKIYGFLIDIFFYGWYKNLDVMRRMVILDLSYNLGLNGLFKFK